MKKFTAKEIATVGILAALVALSLFVLKIPIGKGYIHAGDSLISLSATLNPWIGLLVGGIGALLGDVASNYINYAPWSLVIHGLQGLLLGLAFKKMKKLDIRMFFIVTVAITAVVIVPGYFLADYVMYGWGAAVPYLLWNTFQAIIGGFVGAALFIPFNKIVAMTSKKEEE